MVFLSVSISLLLLSTITTLPTSKGHGILNQPVQRGCLSGGTDYVRKVIDSRAPRDNYAHFPAGAKGVSPGSGLHSQKAAAGRQGWTPYEPLREDFRWRSGVCGDVKGAWPQQHLKQGKYYYNGTIVSTYTQSSVISIGLSINEHHNGFMELHICDISKCEGNEISIECFKQGHCKQLERAWDKKCESAHSKLCGPIHELYKGRWYFPCSSIYNTRNEIEYFGGKSQHSILYKLPHDLVCDHCVLQWYWTSANNCNPPGVIEYFDGPNRPRNWGSCKGQAGAIGGVSRVQPPCAKHIFPEEYIQCADVRIIPSVNVETERRKGFKGVRAIVLYVDGVRLKVLRNIDNVVNAKHFKWATVEAILAEGVSKATFFKNGVRTVSSGGPVFFPGGSRPTAWLPFNEWVEVRVVADGDSDKVKIFLQR